MEDRREYISQLQIYVNIYWINGPRSIWDDEIVVGERVNHQDISLISRNVIINLNGIFTLGEILYLDTGYVWYNSIILYDIISGIRHHAMHCIVYNYRWLSSEDRDFFDTTYQYKQIQTCIHM